MTRYEQQASAAIVAECMGMVAPAEAAFRSRWRMSTLERVDPELYGLLCEQIDLYSTELISGTAADLREHSAAMVRGWSAACRAMSKLPDDAYLTGLDWASKTRVVISDSKQSIQHVNPLEGVRTLAVSPEEVAKLFGGLGIVSLTKATFPDAEVISIVSSEEAA